MATSPLPSPTYSAPARASVPAFLPPASVPPAHTPPVPAPPVHGALPAAPPAEAAHLAPPPAAVAPAIAGRAARRQISPISGMALEALGHAIEYLADEYALHAGRLAAIHAHDPQVEAIQILMAANRKVYYDCPLAPTLSVRCKRVFARLWG